MAADVLALLLLWLCAAVTSELNPLTGGSRLAGGGERAAAASRGGHAGGTIINQAQHGRVGVVQLWGSVLWLTASAPCLGMSGRAPARDSSLGRTTRPRC